MSMTIPGLDVIYQPARRAAEYSAWALNLHEGLCPHDNREEAAR